jgi:gamma-D-glutamyl-L-lysine dipeptidyl-peptidase
VKNNFPYINVYKKKTESSEVVTQLLYGDIFKKININKSWIKIKNISDNYKGYIKNKKFASDIKNTHKVCVLYSNIYSKPNIRNKVNKKLSFGSMVSVTNKKGRFYKFESSWIKKNDVKKISFKRKDVFSDVNKFLNIKYKWGGKNFNGIDCSALVQLFLNFNNRFCPRDSKDQLKYFKKKIKINEVKKNDLIFWKGHVAIVLSKKKLIHAYGPFKKVIIMSINNTIKRIDKTAGLKVIGIRRI